MTAMGLPRGRFNLVACFIESSSGKDRGHHTRRAFFPEQLDSDREFCTSIVRPCLVEVWKCFDEREMLL